MKQSFHLLSTQRCLICRRAFASKQTGLLFNRSVPPYELLQLYGRLMLCQVSIVTLTFWPGRTEQHSSPNGDVYMWPGTSCRRTVSAELCKQRLLEICCKATEIVKNFTWSDCICCLWRYSTWLFLSENGNDTNLMKQKFFKSHNIPDHSSC